MSITGIRQLAQTKLSAECLQADHNLRLIVGHANLLQSLAVRLTDSEDQKIQEFNKKLVASSIKADKLDTHPRQAFTINNGVAVFTSKRVPVCSTYVPVIVEEIEVGDEAVEADEADETDETDEEDEEDKEVDNFTFPDISPQAQPRLAPSTPSLYLPSFSEYERRQIGISSYNDLDVVRRLSDQTRACHSKRVSTITSVIDEVFASIGLDQYFEAAGFTFNK